MKRIITLIAIIFASFAPTFAQDAIPQRFVAVTSTPATCRADSLYKLIVAPFTLWTGGGANVCIAVGGSSSAGAIFAQAYPVSGKSVSAASTTFASPSVVAGYGGETSTQLLMPTAGTLKKLFVRTISAQPSDGSMDVVLRVNGADTVILFNIAANAAAGIYSDTTHTVTVAAGDLVSVKFINNSPGSSSAAMVQLSYLLQ